MRNKNEQFGHPYAVLNLSRIGLRYFRICMNVSKKSKTSLTEYFINHPNVGWIFDSKGWFNFAIGIWAKNDTEINEISEQIRSVMGIKDNIVLQSELTNLYSFGNRKITGNEKPMCVLDSTMQSIELTPTEIDYLKLVTINSSDNKNTISSILNIDKKELTVIKDKLINNDVIVGYQDRINYSGIYFKVFIDDSSKKTENASAELIEKLWNDVNCIYLEKANNKYNIEFEVILSKKSELKKYIKNFKDYKVAILQNNIYTNLLPVSKVANLTEIKKLLLGQDVSETIDFRNSKIWYLNHDAAKSYLDIYNSHEKYKSILKNSETILFNDVANYLAKRYDNQKFNILDIGSGDGVKGKIFIENIKEVNVNSYYPIDIQPIEISVAMETHKNGEYAKHPTLLNIENLHTRFPLKGVPEKHNIALFVGGTYGNFNHHEINSYLKKITNDTNTLIISMPIIKNEESREAVVESYYSHQYENIALGPLLQVGFKKSDFISNENKDNYKVHIEIENKCIVGSFILKKDVELLDRIYKKNTKFKMLTSWKPLYSEFINAIEKDFIIEKTFKNDEVALVVINKNK